MFGANDVLAGGGGVMEVDPRASGHAICPSMVCPIYDRISPNNQVKLILTKTKNKKVKLTKTLFTMMASRLVILAQTSKSWTGVKRTAIASPGSQSLASLFSNVLHESCALDFGTFKRAVPDQFKNCI